jgi:hypothetical protein
MSRRHSYGIYARVHDRTVAAEDYYAAMERIVQRLDVGLPPEPDHAETLVRDGERAQLLELATRLVEHELGVETRLDLVNRLRRMLNHNSSLEDE